jgi:hypothetical protein
MMIEGAKGEGRRAGRLTRRPLYETFDERGLLERRYCYSPLPPVAALEESLARPVAPSNDACRRQTASIDRMILGGRRWLFGCAGGILGVSQCSDRYW